MTGPELCNRAVTNSFDSGVLPRHRWYPIKEGFSAQLITDAIAEFAVDRRLRLMAVEPFSGSGTAPVEFARHAVSCVAFEINPFLAFVGQAKLAHVKQSAFSLKRDAVARGLQKPVVNALESYSTFCEGQGKEKWLFNRSVLRSFSGGWQVTKDCAPAERRLLRLAILRAVMDNCNAYPDGKCLRYKRVKNYNCFNREFLTARFEAYCDSISEDLESSPLPTALARVVNMDSRKISSYRPAAKFDVCVTSPPYLNSFDYSDVYRPELFLGGFVKTNADLMRIRLKTVRSHLQANWLPPKRDGFGALYAKVLKEVCEKKDLLWSERIPQMIQAYFEDIEALLTALKARANKDAKLKIAIGTSAYGGIVIPVDLIIADIGERLGWLLEDVNVVRRLRSSGQHWKHETAKGDVPELRESIVVLRSAA